MGLTLLNYIRDAWARVGTRSSYRSRLRTRLERRRLLPETFESRRLLAEVVGAGTSDDEGHLIELDSNDLQENDVVFRPNSGGTLFAYSVVADDFTLVPRSNAFAYLISDANFETHLGVTLSTDSVFDRSSDSDGLADSISSNDEVIVQLPFLGLGNATYQYSVTEALLVESHEASVASTLDALDSSLNAVPQLTTHSEFEFQLDDALGQIDYAISDDAYHDEVLAPHRVTSAGNIAKVLNYTPATVHENGDTAISWEQQRNQTRNLDVTWRDSNGGLGSGLLAPVTGPGAGTFAVPGATVSEPGGTGLEEFAKTLPEDITYVSNEKVYMEVVPTQFHARLSTLPQLEHFESVEVAANIAPTTVPVNYGSINDAIATHQEIEIETTSPSVEPATPAQLHLPGLNVDSVDEWQQRHTSITPQHADQVFYDMGSGIPMFATTTPGSVPVTELQPGFAEIAQGARSSEASAVAAIVALVDDEQHLADWNATEQVVGSLLAGSLIQLTIDRKKAAARKDRRQPTLPVRRPK